jgi:hypothetical protein
LLAALALEHAHGATAEGIEHRPDLSGLLATMIARSDRVRFELGKDLVFKFVIHELPRLIN